MKAITYIVFLILFLSCGEKSTLSFAEISPQEKEELKPKDYTSTHQEALNFCKEKGYNSDYYFLLDYSIHPGKNRFFIYDFKDKKINKKALVTHGACDVNSNNSNKWEEAKFSNQPNSHCSSKGKYVLGARAESSWGIGIKYWLKGLEKTNNNAVDRMVVLHSWEVVPDKEVFPDPIALSWGCPAVSNKVMKDLDQKIQASSNKKVLLWIIEK